MDKLRRVLIAVVCLAVIVYLVYLYLGGTIIIKEGIEAIRNNISYLLILLVMLYILFNYSIKPRHIKRHKIILAFMGLALISYSYTMLTNNGQEGIYYGDIFTILGVIITFISPSNLLISKKLKEKIKESKVEIIEA